MIRGDGVGAAPREPRPRTDMRRASRRRYGAAMASLWSREPRPRRDATEPSATARPRRPTRARLRRSARGLRPRREQTRVESVAATTWGPDAVDAAERPRERTPPGTLRRGRGRRGLRPRPARGGWARPAGPRRRLARLESAAEPTAKPTADPNAIDAKWRERPRTPRGLGGRGRAREQTADAGPRGRDETTPRTARPRREKHQKQKKTHRSSTSTAARSSRSARRRSSSSVGRRRACCCARTSPRGA